MNVNERLSATVYHHVMNSNNQVKESDPSSGLFLYFLVVECGPSSLDLSLNTWRASGKKSLLVWWRHLTLGFRVFLGQAGFSRSPWARHLLVSSQWSLRPSEVSCPSLAWVTDGWIALDERSEEVFKWRYVCLSHFPGRNVLSCHST